MHRFSTSARRAALSILGATAIGLALHAAAAAAERPAPGDEAPSFTLAGTDGKEHSLAATRGRSAVVLVFYRGVW